LGVANSNPSRIASASISAASSLDALPTDARESGGDEENIESRSRDVVDVGVDVGVRMISVISPSIPKPNAALSNESSAARAVVAPVPTRRRARRTRGDARYVRLTASRAAPGDVGVVD
jgi:hypothetical protein